MAVKYPGSLPISSLLVTLVPGGGGNMPEKEPLDVGLVSEPRLSPLLFYGNRKNNDICILLFNTDIFNQKTGNFGVSKRCYLQAENRIPTYNMKQTGRHW